MSLGSNALLWIIAITLLVCGIFVVRDWARPAVPGPVQWLRLFPYFVVIFILGFVCSPIWYFGGLAFAFISFGEFQNWRASNLQPRPAYLPKPLGTVVCYVQVSGKRRQRIKAELLPATTKTN
jgi:hypothetical protein